MIPPTFKCGKCGGSTIIEPQDGPGVCESCCEDHDYLYERYEGYRCVHCHGEPPPDWYDGLDYD